MIGLEDEESEREREALDRAAWRAIGRGAALGALAFLGFLAYLVAAAEFDGREPGTLCAVRNLSTSCGSVR